MKRQEMMQAQKEKQQAAGLVKKSLPYIKVKIVWEILTKYLIFHTRRDSTIFGQNLMMPILKFISQITLNFLGPKFVDLPLYKFLKWFY